MACASFSYYAYDQRYICNSSGVHCSFWLISRIHVFKVNIIPILCRKLQYCLMWNVIFVIRINLDKCTSVKIFILFAVQTNAHKICHCFVTHNTYPDFPRFVQYDILQLLKNSVIRKNLTATGLQVFSYSVTQFLVINKEPGKKLCITELIFR